MVEPVTSLTYDRVEQAMKDAVPEVQDKYPALLSWYSDPDPYTLFAFVLKPVLKPALKSEDSLVLLRIFRFFEQMACSSDIKVPNLLQIQIFEWLVGEPENLTTAWKYMGDETKNIARRTAQIRHCEDNLPEE